MSASDLAISVRGVGKSYTIRHAAAHAPTTLGEAMLSRLKRPFASRGEKETFWALKDVSFEVKKGEVVGIIGRNGAGKSTLLKILSRITELTEGEVDLFGRVGSLLEVGTGFHQELSGRENIFLNGAILGMTRAEIRKQFDAIVDFAGVEKFLDTPVKRYSSGMYVRLAFAVAAHLRSEILIVDEVLAVGDAEFQKKCLGKMKEVSTDGRTVLFVSHNMQSIRVLCTSALFLSDGRLRHLGDVTETISSYMAKGRNTQNTRPENERPGSGEYRFVSVEAVRPFIASGHSLEFNLLIERRRSGLKRFFVGAHIVGADGQILVQLDSRLVSDWLIEKTAYNYSLRVDNLWLKPGSYTLEAYMGSGGYVDLFTNACAFEVTGELPYGFAANWDATCRGVIFADFKYRLSEPVTNGKTDAHACSIREQ